MQQVIIKKEGHDFFMYMIPTLSNHDTSNLTQEKYFINHIYVPKASTRTQVIPIKDKEPIVSRLLNLTNIPNLLLHLEYKQHSASFFKIFLNFVNRHKVYYLFYEKDKSNLIDLMKRGLK